MFRGGIATRQWHHTLHKRCVAEAGKSPQITITPVERRSTAQCQNYETQVDRTRFHLIEAQMSKPLARQRPGSILPAHEQSTKFNVPLLAGIRDREFFNIHLTKNNTTFVFAFVYETQTHTASEVRFRRVTR